MCDLTLQVTGSGQLEHILVTHCNDLYLVGVMRRSDRLPSHMTHHSFATSLSTLQRINGADVMRNFISFKRASTGVDEAIGGDVMESRLHAIPGVTFTLDAPHQYLKVETEKCK